MGPRQENIGPRIKSHHFKCLSLNILWNKICYSPTLTNTLSKPPGRPVSNSDFFSSVPEFGGVGSRPEPSALPCGALSGLLKGLTGGGSYTDPPAHTPKVALPVTYTAPQLPRASGQLPPK